MKKLLFCFLLISNVAYAQLVPTEWNTDGIKVNPPASTVLAHFTNVNTSGETHVFHIGCASSAAVILFVEHVASDGTTVIKSQAFVLNAFVTFEGDKQIVTLDISEIYRIRTSGALVGSVQCSVYRDQ